MDRDQLIGKLANRHMQSRYKGRFVCIACLATIEKRPAATLAKS
jgi:hypothetical protein